MTVTAIATKKKCFKCNVDYKIGKHNMCPTCGGYLYTVSSYYMPQENSRGFYKEKKVRK